MESKGRLLELDALRGLAALSVVLYHYSSLYPKYAGTEYVTFLNFKYGGYGVELFFIISGFVIYMTIIKCSNVLEFAIKRIIRLYPAYIVSVIITFVATSSYTIQELKVSTKEFIINLSMLQNILPLNYIKNVDGAYWSLAVEITFYIICAVLLSVKLIQKPAQICFTGMASLFLIKLLYSQHLFFPFVMIIGDMEIVQYSHLFVAGISFYQIKNLGFRHKYSYYYHFIILLALMYNFKFNGLVSSVIVVFFFITFYLLLLEKLTFLNAKFLTFFGTISYSLYLIHQNIGYIIINAFENIGLSHQAFIFVPFVFSIGLASLITFLVERPIQKWTRTKLRNREESFKVPKAFRHIS